MKYAYPAWILGVFLFPGLACAQWPVTDAGNLVQNTISASNAILTAANTAKSYIVQGQQLVAEYNTVLNGIKQLEWMATNLTRIPDGLNFIDTITAYSNKITGLLGQATMLSFNLDQATKQFDGLYRQVGTLSSAGDILALRQKLMAARMEASGMTVQVTSIQSNLGDAFTRLCALLSGSVAAKGALDSVQIAAQQEAVLQTTMAQMAAMQATNARVIAQAAAEKAVMEQAEIQAIQAAAGDSKPYTEANGRLTTYHW